MKNILKLVFTIAIVAFCGNISAQNLKLAHINMQELITSMPEYDSAMVKMQKFVQSLEKELEEMNVERNRKLEAYTRDNANLSDIVRQSRGDEITMLNQRIQAFQEQAQESYQVEETKLMQPVYEKANKAIEIVSKEQGITYVLNAQTVLYKAVGTIDLLPGVKQNLGINK